MRKESKFFFINIFSNNYIKILNFYIKVIFYKFFFKIKSNKNQYPKRALDFKNYFKNKIEKNKLYNYKIDQNFELSTPLKSIKLNPLIQWNQLKNEKDYEIKQSFHRFYWLNLNKKYPSIEIFEKILNSWYSNFCSEKVAWHPYTSTERLVSILFFLDFNLNKSELLNIFKTSSVLNEVLDKTYNTILNNIEYTQEGNTFNHVVNNYKGLILCGLLYRDDELVKKSLKILLFELESILEDDFFFREGSSHYQLIISKWLLEIEYFFKIFDKKIHNSEFFNVSNLILDKASFFVVQGLKLKIPLFGDISPDFTPNWVLNFIYKFNKNKFFEDAQIKNLDKLTLYNSKNKIFNFINFTRINRGFWTLFVKHSNCQRPYFPDHSHEDESQFVLFYKGNPLIIDPGRVNYNFKFNKDKFCLSSAHNIARLNGISCFSTRNYPYIPSNLKHPIEKTINKEGTQLIIELTSNSVRRINHNNNDKYVRRFLLNENEFTIEDNFIIKKTCKYELSINFYKDLNINQINQKSFYLGDKLNNFIVTTNNKYKISNSSCSESYNDVKNCKSVSFSEQINRKFNNRVTIKLFS